MVRRADSRIHAAFEASAIVATLTVSAALAARIWTEARGPAAWGVVGSGAVLGYLLADLISGIVHWLADRFGTVRTPLFGEAFVRPFREHHAHPEEITRHGFIETNGNNCIFSFPPLFLAFLFLEATAGGGLRLFFLGLVLFASLCGFATNQFHKWAHTKEPPAVARMLQRARLILPPEHHSLHHTSPFASHYCITTGWLNWPLDRLKIFWGVERLIRRPSGSAPPFELSLPTK